MLDCFGRFGHVRFDCQSVEQKEFGMKLKTKTILTAIAAAGMALRVGAAEAGLCKDADEVVAKAIARAQDPKMKAGREGYEFTQKVVIEESTPKGESKSKKEREWQVVIHDGHAERTLVKADPPVPKESKGANKTPKANPYDVPVDEKLLERYEWTLRGMENFEGEQTYVLDFKPKQPGKGSKIEDRFVNTVAGTLWVHTRDFEAMKVEFEIVQPIHIMGGLVGSCDYFKATTLRQKLPDGIWMDKSTHSSLTLRKLFTTTKVENETVSTDFKKPAGAQARSVGGEAANK